MRNKISVLFIDPKQDEHDYSRINLREEFEYNCLRGEKEFDINIISNTENLLSELNKLRGVDVIVSIGKTDGSEVKFGPLNELSFEFRKKWIHREVFEPISISRNIIEAFLFNINRPRPQEVKLFSIFTCTFNTPKAMFERLYQSLISQTYNNWNWYILDDSTNPYTSEMINNYHDPRIVIFKNYSNHGNIGFNKHMIAMACDGDYLVEVDHDDELTPDCLKLLNEAFTRYPDTDFVYSYAMEEIDGKEVWYGDHFAYGLGYYQKELVKGVLRNIAITPDVNALSVRGIHALPNHVRCWKKEFYHSIGGHNIELSVLDDMDILIRTFLNGKMTKIPKVLYIQHEGNRREGKKRGNTAQSERFDEIQRTNDLLKQKYDKHIHARLIELGVEDPFWLCDRIGSDIIGTYYDPKDLVTLSHTFEV